jgi:ATP-dependent helicase IRC3
MFIVTIYLCMLKVFGSSDETTAMLEQRAANAIASADSNEIWNNSDSYDNVPNPKSVTYTDYENPFSLVDKSSGAPHIAKLSTNAWVGCGNNIYVLECLGKGYIRIEPVVTDSGMCQFSQVYTFKLSVIPKQRTRRILRHISRPPCYTWERRRHSKCLHSCEVEKF